MPEYNSKPSTVRSHAWISHWSVAGLCIVWAALPWIDWWRPIGSGVLIALTGAAAGCVLLVRLWHGPAFRLTRVDAIAMLLWAYCALNTAWESPGLMLAVTTSIAIYMVGRQMPEYKRTWLCTLWLAGTWQAGAGIMQFLGWFPVENTQFPVSGTFPNPGPWGGYLALAWAAALALWLHHFFNSRTRKIVFALTTLLLLCGLLLADSRAAWLGWLVSSGAFAVIRWHIRLRRWLPGALLAGFILSATAYAYRPASADARLTIWKSSLLLWTENPLTGVGTYRFPAHYMNAQAEYLNQAHDTERLLAADNLLAYNEPIHWLCEQGLLGTGLVVVLALTGIRMYRHKKGCDCLPAAIPLLALSTFGLFSYPSEVWPLCAWFPLLLASLLPQSERYMPAVQVRLIPMLLCAAFATGSAYRASRLYQADQALTAWWHTNTDKSRNDIHRYIDLIRDDPDALDFYAQMLFQNEYYDAVISEMNRLAELRLSADLLADLGRAYVATDRYQEAHECFARSSRMVPGLLTPHYLTLQLLRDEGHTAQAIHTARQIIHFKPKVESHLTRAMQKEALHYLILCHKK